jgi:hypothetical protein
MKRVLMGVAVLASVGLTWAGPVDKSVDTILDNYFKIQSALAQDKTAGIDGAAKAIQTATESVKTSDPEVKTLVTQIQSAAGKIQGQSLEAARGTFFELSRPLLVYLNKYHSSKDGYYRFFCPMAKKGWIQSDEDTRNPYYGTSMLKCGELIK